jgi:predicted amidohydrolase YtcJ
MFHPKAARLVVLAVTAAVGLGTVATGCGRRPHAPSPTSPPEEPTIPPTAPTVIAEPFSVPIVTTQAPTLIFYNGTVLTMDGDRPTAEAIAVAGDLILAVGTDEDILALEVADTRVVDLQGTTLMPGFVDSHTHIFNDAGRYLGSNDYEGAQELALRNGITTLGNMYVVPEFLAEMQAMESSRRLRVRTSLYMNYTTNCGEAMGEWYREHPPTREPGEMLRIGGVKLFADGGSCGSDALSYELPGLGYGDLWFTQNEMNAMVADIDAHGYQLVIHAAGDRAVEQALNAIEFALDGQPNTLRHRIEHNSVVRPDLIPRYSEVGAVVTIHGAYYSCEAAPPPPEYRDWQWPYRELMLANPEVHIAWHGDYPWVGPASPLLHLYSMVTPREIISDDRTECDDPAGWTTERIFSVDEVLPMMTIEAAYALFRDEEVGSLEPGKFADMIILSGDPTSIDPNAIKDLEVWMTMVGGQVEWCASGHAALCPFTAGGDPYIDRVVSFTPGEPANPDFRIADTVLGPPDFDEQALTGFLALGVGGVLTVEFVDNLAVDGPGDDIDILGDPYDDDRWIIEVSTDCSAYVSFGEMGERASVDLASVGLASVRCLRFTDDGSPAGEGIPGAELDAVEALNSGLSD